MMFLKVGDLPGRSCSSLSINWKKKKKNTRFIYPETWTSAHSAQATDRENFSNHCYCVWDFILQQGYNKMSENHGARLSYREMFKSRPYVVPITFILQDSPDMMLTFTQLMDRLEEFVSESPKSFKSVIRNLLSSNPCFSKIPVSPEAKRNYWKLDHSKITEKMVRGNFRGILEWFPELTKVTKGMLTTPDHYTTLHSPAAAACKAVNSRCEVKFSSSFSIDSILKKDSPSALCRNASPLSEESIGSVKGEQEPSWSAERTAGLKRKFTWESSLRGDGAATRPTKRIFMSPDSSNATGQERFNNCKTYLAMIAFVLQDSPEKMLTFSQLMDRLEEFGSGRTKSFESNIRVCLSTQTCFFKIPAKSEAQWNFWKLDHSKITEKMVRRHFKGIQELFPELTTVRKEMLTTPPPPPPHRYTALLSPEAVNSNFRSSFSIDSILEKAGPPCLVSSVLSMPW